MARVTVHGMICATNPEGAKDKDGKSVPTTDLYSNGEVVTVRNLAVSDKAIGTYADILCDLKFGSYEGRSYHTYTAVKQNS